MSVGKKRRTVGYQLWSYTLTLFNVILITVPFAMCWYWCYADNI